MTQLSQLCRNDDIKGYKDITFHFEITPMYFLPKTSYFSLVDFSSSPLSVTNCSYDSSVTEEICRAKPLCEAGQFENLVGFKKLI